ncbi:phosphoglycerate kinase [Paenibacillus darwinianus]|uniref:Phosphoglycerate kinase n=1 Tax=Paenibacillus darwinianus TaxID=1380763 RepID=A0A9W5W8Q6_9BACL|nr:histidine phosphatase family protein [Paenibacillus darwinianus]EXX91293.1 phosphoglycerate kinase [Paenibacillus darwinianus]EXX92109.1 phosphoglycerate kinase [Paenibacillus darwinianus]EXX92562.1 phosphoglycerate kinase [Paenibacillus darwinianus]
MIIGLIRHGKTDWNALGRIQGQTDIPLNEEGKRQAEALALRLSGEGRQWDAIVSSDLRRAGATAAIIAARLGIPRLPSDPRLRERFFGEVEGTTEEERLLRWGPDWRKADAGQESDESVQARSLAFVQEMLTANRHPRLLVVSHGSLLAQLLRGMCDKLDDSHLVNMSLSVLQYEAGAKRWNSVLHNCTNHLKELTPKS